jgi:hypothetical protein
MLRCGDPARRHDPAPARRGAHPLTAAPIRRGGEPLRPLGEIAKANTALR